MIEILEQNYPDNHLVDKVMGLNNSNNNGIINIFNEQIKVNDDISKYENIRIMLQRHKKGTSHPLHLVNKSSDKSRDSNNSKFLLLTVIDKRTYLCIFFLFLYFQYLLFVLLFVVIIHFVSNNLKFKSIK